MSVLAVFHFLLWMAGVLVALLLLLWLFKELTMGICFCSREDLAGKTVLVTGGTGGIGFEAALELAKWGAHVVITGRNMEKVCDKGGS